MHTLSDQLVQDVLDRKSRQNDPYVENPSLSIIVQSFNHVDFIDELAERIRLTSAEEVIVCEDGSIDGSRDKWMTHLTEPNDFLIHSNDLHEIRMGNRAVDMARGEIVCLIQDDDELPQDGTWTDHALSLFSYYNDLGILGGHRGFNNWVRESWGYKSQPLAYRDPIKRKPFMFVECVNIGPYFIRKTAFNQVGGFDTTYSNPGEPGIGFDLEICYRMWRQEYKVGLCSIPVKTMPGHIRGTMLWTPDVRHRNHRRNRKRTKRLHRRSLSKVQQLVLDANAILEPIEE